jgi:hypothetical protein
LMREPIGGGLSLRLRRSRSVTCFMLEIEKGSMKQYDYGK